MKRILFRYLSLLPMLIFAFGILSCKKETPMVVNNAPVTPTPPNSGDTMLKYLALGDSYTIGHSLSEKERFPYLVVSQLRSQGLQVADPRYIAQTGWSTIALQSAIQSAESLTVYDFVTLLIGVNDQYQHLDTAGYRTRFGELLSTAVALAGGRPSRVFVLSIPDYSATPFVGSSDKELVRKEIDAFNQINKEITIARNIMYINITPETRKAADDRSLLAGDGLHYSAKEHHIWAQMVVPYILKSLGK